MKARDVATIAFRLFAVWITVSAVTALIDLIFNWRTVWAETSVAFSGVVTPPTEREVSWTTARIKQRLWPATR